MLCHGFSLGQYHPNDATTPSTVDVSPSHRQRRSVNIAKNHSVELNSEENDIRLNVQDLRTRSTPKPRKYRLKDYWVSGRAVDSWFVFVFENSLYSSDASDVMRVQTVHDLCAVSQNILTKFDSNPKFAPLRAFSIADSIMEHARGVQYACADIMQEEVDAFFHDLFLCRQYLSGNFSQSFNVSDSAPYACRLHAAILQEALDFVLDVNIIREDHPLNSKFLTFLVQVDVIVTYFRSIEDYKEKQTDFYFSQFDGKELHTGSLTLSAMRFPMGDSLKWAVFKTYIVSDIRWFILALALVVFVMFVYMLRFDLVVATLISIVSGFVLAYFTYFQLYCAEFFPFINILALLILIAIGADDVFVFFDIFEQIRLAHPNIGLQKMIGKTLRHAVTSVFVTSFTTAAAFFANSVSEITAIRLFGMFAATAVLFNFFVMVLVVPSVIVLSELLIRHCAPARFLRRVLDPVTGRASAYLCGRKHNFPSRFLRRTWFVWLLLLTALGVSGMFVVFVKPRFELPITKNFQLFPVSNPLESWDVRESSHFSFASTEGEVDQLTFFYMWGFQSDDPGNHCNPKDRNSDTPVVLDDRFDFYAPESQAYLLDYCRKTKTRWNRDYAVCVLEVFEEVAQQVCSIRSRLAALQEPLLSSLISVCCSQERVPFSRTQLDRCGPIFLLLYKDPDIANLLPMLDLSRKKIFDHFIYELSEDVRDTNHITGYVLAVTTDYVATYEYAAMKKHYDDVTATYFKDMTVAPFAVNGGFCAFTDWFWFYDMQHSLATGTYFSIALSLLTAFVVMLVTSLNLVITVYAMLTISFAIASTVAVLVLLGWHLNIIESIIVSLGVGLSIDFAIHYGVAYRLSREPTSKKRTAESFERVGSAVVMAAVTTFLAGASMMPCHVLAYRKLGVFLMLVMTFAWCYATLFFQSICYMFGPIGLCCFKKRVTLRSLFSRKISVRADPVSPMSAASLADRNNDVMFADDAPLQLLDRNSNGDSDDESAIVSFGEL